MQVCGVKMKSGFLHFEMSKHTYISFGTNPFFIYICDRNGLLTL